MATPTIGGNPDPSQIANTTNSVIRDVQAMQDVQVFKDDTGTRRVLMGRGPNGFYGLKVSREGNDVYDATNDQLVFNSDNNLFKIAVSGTATVAGYTVTGGSSNTADVTVTHNLGFVPTVIAYRYFASDETTRQFGGDRAIVWDISTSLVTSKVVVKENIYTTTTTVRFSVYTANGQVADYGPTADYTIKYYLLQETAN